MPPQKSQLLKEQLVNAGHWLFRWRSYLPLIVLCLLLPDFHRLTVPSQNPTLDKAWVVFCLGVSLLGLAIRIYTMGYVPWNTSGRGSFQRAEQLNTKGIYSVVRNPLYLGNFWIWFGVSLYARQWWTALITALIFALYHERIIMAEENFLEEKFGDSYRAWAAATPAFFPSFTNWISPEQAFCWRTAIKREYLGLFAIVATFTSLETIRHYLVAGKFFPDFLWTCIFLTGFSIFVVVRIVHKKTRLLQVWGR